MITCDSPACGAVTDKYEIVIVRMADGRREPEAWCEPCCDMWRMHDNETGEQE